jgi:type IV fimbrial biogenesis protein FimT
MKSIFIICQHRGFTLVETLSTALLASIALILGVPQLNRLAANNRIHTAVNSFTTHLHLARSEAVKRGRRVVICPSADGRTCLGSDGWSRGYMLFVDADADRRRDQAESVLRHHSIDPARLAVHAGHRRTISYLPSGWAPGSNLTVTFCDPGGRADPKAVVVSMTGRPRKSDTHPNGEALSCDLGDSRI